MMAEVYELGMSGARAGQRGALYQFGVALSAACYFTLIWGPLVWLVVKNGLRRWRADPPQGAISPSDTVTHGQPGRPALTAEELAEVAQLEELWRLPAHRAHHDD
jgi:hypothetical protein